MCLYNKFIDGFNNKPPKYCKTCVYSDRDARECLESDECDFINDKYDNFVKNIVPMKTKKHKKDILTLFENYLNNHNRVELVEGLTAIENIYKADKNTNKHLWFRFFKGDTAATTIFDIQKDLDVTLTPVNNFSYMVNNLKTAIEQKELEIYFS